MASPELKSIGHCDTKKKNKKSWSTFGQFAQTKKKSTDGTAVSPAMCSTAAPSPCNSISDEDGIIFSPLASPWSRASEHSFSPEVPLMCYPPVPAILPPPGLENEAMAPQPWGFGHQSLVVGPSPLLHCVAFDYFGNPSLHATLDNGYVGPAYVTPSACCPEEEIDNEEKEEEEGETDQEEAATDLQPGLGLVVQPIEDAKAEKMQTPAKLDTQPMIEAVLESEEIETTASNPLDSEEVDTTASEPSEEQAASETSEEEPAKITNEETQKPTFTWADLVKGAHKKQ